MSGETIALIGLACSVVGALVGYFGHQRNVKKDSQSAGQETGMVLTELGYIKGGIDDLKTEQREQRKTNTEFITRLTAVESSAKQAHKRIDRIEGREDRE